jgi:hypothetical protein
MVVTKRNLPAWYYRVSALTMTGDRALYPEDFDEDLSDLEEKTDKEEAESTLDCECDGEDSECECQIKDDEDVYDSDDSMSDRSYDGSDAEDYYELKEREERKRELRNIREEKEEQRIFERSMEKEVHDAYESLKKIEMEGETPPLDFIARKRFRLFSIDYVDHCDHFDFDESKFVEFYYLDENGNVQPPPDREVEQMRGQVYLNADSGCELVPFLPPKHASLEDYRLKGDDGKYELTFQFLSNDYLKLKVSRELVFMDESQPPHAPEFFKFVGIHVDREKEKAERERREVEKTAQRPPSPRESWFEMNHPQGYYRSHPQGYYKMC